MIEYKDKEKLEEQKVFIGGEWTASGNGDTYSIINPSTGKPFVECQKCNAEDAKQAIDAAREAFDHGPWPEMSFEDRIKIFYKASDMIDKVSSELGVLDAMSNGVPITTNNATILNMSPNFKYVCKRVKEVMGSKMVAGEYSMGMETEFWREPDGVVAIITPWNVPFWQMALKLPSALIAGNTVVFKPASQTPLSALEVGKIFGEAGLPKGALNVITGPGSVVGAELARSDKVDHISLTGEVATGEETVRNASGSLKKVTLELGGKSPNIIFDDFPIDEAAKMAVLGISLANGEECFAGTRVLVQDTIYEEVAKKTAELYGSSKVGNALLPDTNLGPLVTEEQMKKVLRYIEFGKEEGAKLLCGGERLLDGELKDGFFVAPTVFSEVSNDMKIAQEEIFGPVLSIIPFSTEEEAIEIANDSKFGLGAGIMSMDREKATRVARKLRAGFIFINMWHMVSPDMPYGGYKQSGWGRMAGDEGIKQFTQIKSIYPDWDGATGSLMKTLLLPGG